MSQNGTIYQFLKHQRSVLKRSRNTIRSYAAALKAFNNAVVHINANPNQATRAHVEQFIEQLSEEGKAPSTIKNRVAALSAFFDYLVVRGLANTNPTKGVALPKIPEMLPRSVDYADIKAKIEAVDGDDFQSLRDRALLELGWACAARVSDLTNANVRDVDWKKLKIRIFGKGEKEDDVNFGIEARDALVRYTKERVKLFGLEEEALFLNCNGRRLSTVGRIVKERVGFSPHPIFRHSAASVFLEHGADIEEVRAHLRHNSISTTARYVKARGDRLKSAYMRHYPRALRNDHIQIEVAKEA